MNLKLLQVTEAASDLTSRKTSDEAVASASRSAPGMLTRVKQKIQKTRTLTNLLTNLD